MRNRDIGEIKKAKAFAPGDIIIYAAAAVCAAVLLCVFLIPQKSSAVLDGIDIYYGETVIFSYDFSEKSATINKDYADNIVTEREGDTVFVTIRVKEGYNKLEIDAASAKMTEADCGPYAECVNDFPPITQGGDVIVCLPHRIKVVGTGAVTNEVKL
jgi:hypothetical protein